jgi:branched-chain amino acid transport system permease protein
MSIAWQYFIVTLLVYYGVNLIAGWALNLQFGIAGVMNFAFIIYQAAGAYTAAVLTLGPVSANGGYQSYIGGLSLPWPLPILIAGVVGALFATLVGLFALLPEKRDFQAVLMLIVSLSVTLVISHQTGWFNGTAGLSAIPKPLGGVLNLGLAGYGWFYVGLTAVVVAAVYGLVHRITSAPWARRLKAMRDNPLAAAALGTDVRKERLIVSALAGGIAAVSGALLVQFISAWAPAGWGYGETFLYFTAIVVGGLGNNAGVALGTAVVYTVILEGVQYLPSLGGVSSLTASLQQAAIGVLVLLFLWLRPQGLIPERRRRLRAQSKVAAAPAIDESASAHSGPGV